MSPDHHDENPPMHLYDDHAHCFACGFHGDVTDVWAAKHDLDRPLEAALDLARQFGIELPEGSPKGSQKARELLGTGTVAVEQLVDAQELWEYVDSFAQFASFARSKMRGEGDT